MEESTPSTSTTHGKADAEVTNAAKMACFIVVNDCMSVQDVVEGWQKPEGSGSTIYVNRLDIAPGNTETGSCQASTTHYRLDDIAAPKSLDRGSQHALCSTSTRRSPAQPCKYRPM